MTPDGSMMASQSLIIPQTPLRLCIHACKVDDSDKQSWRGRENRWLHDGVALSRLCFLFASRRANSTVLSALHCNTVETVYDLKKAVWLTGKG